MKITICGSMSFAKEMTEIAAALEQLGHQVLVPLDTEDHLKDASLKGSAREREHVIALDAYRDHYHKIEQSDAILVLNLEKHGVDGYVGTATALEIGVAYYLYKKIFVYQAVLPDSPVAEELDVFSAVVIEKDLTRIG